MLDWLRRLSRWDKGLLLLVSIYLLLWPIEPLSQSILRVRIALQISIYVIGSVVLVRFATRGTKALTRRFLWRVRHRMIAVYLFVGFIPLGLAITLAGLGLVLLFGPLAAYMVSSKIEQRAATLQGAAASFGWEMRATDAEARGEAARRFIEHASESFPGIMLRVDTPRGPVGFPTWLVSEQPPSTIDQYRGVIRREGRLYLAGHAQYAPDAPSVLLMIPLTAEYLAELLPGLGVVERMEFSARAARSSLTGNDAGSVESVRTDTAEETSEGSSEAAGSRNSGLQQRLQDERSRLPPPAHPFDWEISWPAQVRVLYWETGESRIETVFALLSRYSAVGGLLFSNQSMQIARGVRIAAYVLAGLFFTTVVTSFVVALSLTRTMTRTVHDLYLGTERINQGDFAHRVPIRGKDQLSELAISFNSMTESIERLIEESRERQRLQAELEIAREVQMQLFPHAAPNLKSLELLGVCRPARVVSGDFYDYVELTPTRLALALGDVSGKGISAALVMATLHSIVRTQLSLLARSNGELALSTAELVARANHELHAQTSAEKFATLFFASYDEKDSHLSYSNAGHLPPLLIRNGQPQRLEPTGMLAGAFPQADYESRVLELRPGDLLIAYTDGLTEPENAYQEEFGETRLIESLLRHADRPLAELIEAVMQEVTDWTGETTLQDDMTVLAARRLS